MLPLLLASLSSNITEHCVLPRSANKIGLLLELNNGEATIGAAGVVEQPSAYDILLACSAMLAIEHSNQGDGRVIPAFATAPSLHLEGHLFDTRGLPSLGVEAYREARDAGVAVNVGATRSTVTQPVGVLSAFDELPMIGYWSSSPLLSDATLYPNFHRVFPSDIVMAHAVASMLPQLGYSHFSIMHVQDIWGFGFAAYLEIHSRTLNITVDRHAWFTDGDESSVRNAVAELATPGAYAHVGAVANVIVLLCYPGDLPAVLAEADRQKMLEAPYIWFVPDSIFPEHPNAMLLSGALSAELFKKLDGFHQLLISPESVPAYEQYKQAWREMTPDNCTRLVPMAHEPLPASSFDDGDMIGAYLYDATATAALALRTTQGGHRRLSEGERSSDDGAVESDGAQVAAAIRGLSFAGATGDVGFDPLTGDRATSGQQAVHYNWRLSSETQLTSVPIMRAPLDTMLAGALDATEEGDVAWSPGSDRVPATRGSAPRDAIGEAVRRDKQRKEDREHLRWAVASGLGTAFVVVAIVACVLVAMRLRPEAFRPTVRILSHDDGSVAPNVSFITDIEGNWEYFQRYVEMCDALSFPTGKPEFNAEGACDLELADGWRFIHGGDTCDKGGVVGGSIRVVRTLIRLKRKYPSRVVLLLGNRDLNKMRMTSELDTHSQYYERSCVDGTYQGAKWLPAAKRVSPDLFLRRDLATTLNCNPEEVPQEAVDAADTLPNRLRWMYKETMGAEGEFERQWAEQALLRKVKQETISEYDVARQIIMSVMPGGAMRELLELGQLAFVHADILFVHGGLIGGPWEGGGDGAHCFGYVPGRAERVANAREWVQMLNEWKQTMLASWMRQPFWGDPAPGGTAPTRAADAIIDYVAPGCVPSVVMGRHQDKKGMPKPVPRELVEALGKSGITKLALGHTPQGNAPTAVQCGGLTVVVADTSFSDMSASDKRGVAVSEVQFLLDGSVRVMGVLQDERIISFAMPDPATSLLGFQLPAVEEPPQPPAPEQPEAEQASGSAATSSQSGSSWGDAGSQGSGHSMREESLAKLVGGKAYHIKAWLPEEEQYLLCNVDGFVVSYLALTKSETQILLERARRLGGDAPTEAEIDRASTKQAAVAVTSSRPMLHAWSSPKARMNKAKAKLQKTATGSMRHLPIVRTSAATSTGSALQGAATPRALFEGGSLGEGSRKNVQVQHLGETDIIGLADDAIEEMRKTLSRTLNSKEGEEGQMKILSKQARRLGSALYRSNAERSTATKNERPHHAERSLLPGFARSESTERTVGV